ncbi:nicotinate-nucleotide adenylyltransferase [Ureibacillus sp. FSL K6-8385]|uniref:Probable nicotinate-nucleotide adenylyltransferase n=1 Tax=Ureibacillus terrenus TaxID=118246 RepID=A0A540V6K8_9BACL|nr:nicotinate-nucleotide adenylyltransferase [Ureibacillus terrenus]MED3661497.1 nicotinate-nucleotide adenylyltransferase [Ureibacillus terrenus]MED3763964.1 nicotinate-nucleotide adenylyltransferase [Ureibacillus terrenus]TQE91813.1 nicotinate-nucleotide adenylyltransferase [Ureibacillus terrenus]
MKKVGILGGTFNPPHIGHLIMANEVYHALKLDEVRFMPNAIAPHKTMPKDSTAENRLRMVELLVKPFKEFTVETIELERGGVSYTYDTMVALKEREPDTEFYFIIGGDMIDTLHTWHKIDELLELVKFVGIRRPGTKSQTSYDIIMVEAPEIALSSTLIRKRFATGGTLRFLLPPEVEAYIRKEGLYGAK